MSDAVNESEAHPGVQNSVLSRSSHCEERSDAAIPSGFAPVSPARVEGDGRREEGIAAVAPLPRNDCNGEGSLRAGALLGAALYGSLTAALAALAVWPVWVYLAWSYLPPAGDPTGAVLLVTALGWIVWLVMEAAGGPGASLPTAGCPPEAESRTGAPGIMPTAGLLVLYAMSYAGLSALARAVLGLAAVGAALMGLPGVGWRKRSGLFALLLLAAPPPETLNFFLGGPLRRLSTVLAAFWLAASGTPVRADGTTLWIGERIFSVDAPCSGVNGLLAGAAVAAALAAWRRLSPGRTLLLGLAAVALCILGNGWRAAALVHASRYGMTEAHPAHAGVGLVVFAVTLLALGVAARWLVRGGEASSVKRQASSTRPSHAGFPIGEAYARPREAPQSVVRNSARMWLSVLVAAAAAGAAPLIPGQDTGPAASAFPGFPDEWLGSPLRRLAAAEMDRRWAALSPAPLGRFALADGSELLLRWVERPGRGLHPAEDCYRGSGYRVTPLSPVTAPAPPSGRAVVWRRFRAERSGEILEVREVILSQRGDSYPDPSWWWWRVSGPGAADPGPWWMAVVQHRR